jgi:GNAT superfamily N-acetyltransferase
MIKMLSDKLILRSLSDGTPQDKANLAQFYVDVFTEAYGPEDEIIGPWVGDLISDKHPTVTDDDIWVVVDPSADDQIVSATLLIPQTWRYETVELPVGRVELVATHKDYRNRGLIRELFNALHERSKTMGHNVQTITGIPYFYRQFGYTMAVDLGSSASIPFKAISKLKDDQKPDFTLRPATTDDISKLMAWDEYYASQRLLSVVRPAEYWEYEILHRNPQTDCTHTYLIIVDQDGEDVGHVAVGTVALFERLSCVEYVVGENASYLATYDDVMRGIKAYAEEKFVDNPPYYVRFDSGLYETMRTFWEKMPVSSVNPTNYAWYIRVADPVKLIHDLKPILEQRLQGSRANRYSGQLHISFYRRSGLLIKFKNGCITDVSEEAPAIDKEDAAFPFDTFLNVVFGHRTVKDLNAVLPEAYANRKATILLEAMFPKKSSWIMPLY